jgi:hypothetical protein
MRDMHLSGTRREPYRLPSDLSRQEEGRNGTSAGHFRFVPGDFACLKVSRTHSPAGLALTGAGSSIARVAAEGCLSVFLDS